MIVFVYPTVVYSVFTPCEKCILDLSYRRQSSAKMLRFILPVFSVRQRIAKSDTFQISAPNAWTGFRNICERKKWKK